MAKGQGRKKRPTAISAAKGVAPYKPVRNRDEPRPDRGLPPVPRWLSADARDDWDYYCDVLDKAGVLTVADGAILGSLCMVLLQMDRCRTIWEAEKDLHTPGAKRIADMYSNADQRMAKRAASLGLEPSSRAGLYTGGGAGEERSAMEKFQLEGEQRQKRLRRLAGPGRNGDGGGHDAE